MGTMLESTWRKIADSPRIGYGPRVSGIFRQHGIGYVADALRPA
jgi:hypothetical protein